MSTLRSPRLEGGGRRGEREREGARGMRQTEREREREKDTEAKCVREKV